MKMMMMAIVVENYRYYGDDDSLSIMVEMVNQNYHHLVLTNDL